MENLDLLVLRTLLAWRREGKRAMLATVVRTWGSSPRPVGSIMALSEDSNVVGSVSGGCIEDDLIRQHIDMKMLSKKLPQFVKYGVTADEAHKFGLPCGGTLEVLLEYDINIVLLEELVQYLSQGELVKRVVRLADGCVSLIPTKAPSELELNELILTNTFGPEFRMLIIGAGQMSEYLATMAIFNGFNVTVCDPREEYSKNWSVAGVHFTSEMPDDVVIAMKLDRRACVVALTHDPKLDDLALLDALETEAFYIGAIGSRRNSDSRAQRMMEHFGKTKESLARLHGPIGIYIGSKTPSEIAVSVMAEILAIKNGVQIPKDMSITSAKNQSSSLNILQTGSSCNINEI